MTQIQHEQLKPCPFCGGAASGDGYVYYSRPCNDTAWDDGSPITEAFFCNCPSCGVSNLATGIGYRSKAEAIAAWNTRAPITVQDAARALVAAVKAGVIDPFDCTDLAVEALAIKHAGNRRDGVGQLEIAEEFFVAALTAIAEGRA